MLNAFMKQGSKKMKQEEEKINEALLNVIAPSAVDHDRSHLNVSEHIGRVVCISKYPNYVDYGWLSAISNLESTITVIEYRYTPPDKIIASLNKKVSELKENIDLAKKESDKEVYINSHENILDLIKRIAVKGEPVGYVNIMLYITANNEVELEARIRRIQSILAVSECGIRTLIYKQMLAFQAFSPYGIPNFEDVSNMGERPMPISTLVGGFPSASSVLFDPKGFYFGKTKDDKLVLLNQWLRTKDRTNSNWFISGMSGTGKSTALKLMFLKEFWQGTKIILFDPEREYVDLTRHETVQGDVIDCSGVQHGRINPLQVRASCKISKEDLEQEESLDDYFLYEENQEENGSDLALFLQQLRLFFSSYFGKENYTIQVRTILERCLIELYEKFGIVWDTDISKIGNESFPIISDLYDHIKNKISDSQNTYDTEILHRLLLFLEPASYGADQFIWNGYTTLNPQSSFIDLDVSSLLELDDNVKRAQFYNLLTWGWHQMSMDRSKRVIFGIDEGHLFVDPDYPEIMKYIKNISKRGRKYECGLMFITQSVVDILDPAVKRYGQAIIDSACYKLLMGTDGKNLEETRKLFNLSEKETGILSSMTRGQGVLMCGKKRLKINVDVSEEILDILGSAGGR